MKKLALILGVLFVIGGATMVLFTPAVEASGPWFSSLYTSIKHINSGYETIADSLRVGGEVTFNGGFTANGASLQKFGTVAAYSDSSLAVTSSYYGKTIVNTYNGAQFFTLPAPAAGTVGAYFYVIQNIDQNITIKGASADQIVATNNLVADNIAYTTSSQKIGACVLIYGISATKWAAINLSTANAMTVGS
jgi:hypothetical protein